MALDLAQLQALLDTAQSADQFKKDVQRALKKVGNSLSALQASLDEANQLLSRDYQPASKERKPRTRKEKIDGLLDNDPDAPFGRKADGTPKQKPGRGKANAQ